MRRPRHNGLKWVGSVTRLTGLVRRGRSLGQRGERAAARYLKVRHYRILARNVRNRFGEVDLLAQADDGKTVVVVEVKAGRQGSVHRPEVHVTADKQRRLTALAAQLARRYNLTHRPWRFDVIAVEFAPEGRKANPVIRHHRAAFQSKY